MPKPTKKASRSTGATSKKKRLGLGGSTSIWRSRKVLISALVVFAGIGGYMVWGASASSGNIVAVSGDNGLVGIDIKQNKAIRSDHIRSSSPIDKHPRRQFAVGRVTIKGSSGTQYRVYTTDGTDKSYTFTTRQDCKKSASGSYSGTISLLQDASFRSDSPGSGLPRLAYIEETYACKPNGRDFEPRETTLYVANADGSNKRRLIHQNLKNWEMHNVIWHSPTESIYYSLCPVQKGSGVFNSNCRVYKWRQVGNHTSNTSIVTSSQASGFDLARGIPFSISGDGKWVAFAAKRWNGGEERIYFSRTDGKDLRLLTSESGPHFFLRKRSLSAAGSKLIYSSRKTKAVHSLSTSGRNIDKKRHYVGSAKFHTEAGFTATPDFKSLLITDGTVMRSISIAPGGVNKILPQSISKDINGGFSH